MLNFLKPYWLEIVKYGALIIGVMAVLFSARQAGKHAERVGNLETSIKRLKKDAEIDARPHLGDTDLINRL